MGAKGSALADIQELPESSLILLAGAPGAGKSTFCQQVVLNGVAADRPVIFVTTERSASEVITLLREQGLGDPAPGLVNLVDAFSDTVGANSPHRSDTVHTNSMDLNSLSIAIAKLQGRAEQKGTLLVLDSLTTPYLFNGAGVGFSAPPQRAHGHGQRHG